MSKSPKKIKIGALKNFASKDKLVNFRSTGAVLFSLAVFALLAYFLFDGWNDLRTETFTLRPLPLTISFLLGLLNVVSLYYIWRYLLQSLNPGSEVASRRTTLSIFTQSWFGRYIPGKVWMMASKVYLGIRAGMQKETLLVSTGFEYTLSMAAQAVITFGFAVGIFYSYFNLTYGYIVLAALVIAFGFGILHPRILLPLINGFFRLVRFNQMTLPEVLSYRAIFVITLLYMIPVVLTGASFVFLTVALVELSLAGYVLAGAAYITAHFVGRLIFILPAGIGAREGVLVSLLGSLVVLPIAVLAAVLSRILFILVDLVFGALVFILLNFGKQGGDMPARFPSGRSHDS